ncbi:ABC transporter ATP-binding protein [Rhodobacter sp. Har01]|uniref:ABC transporter ATP-binding protein n=1 Tax=Rhodobacter sp. Har01 TaxID=2883999 RepID=UPI001D095569|nr:ABC transporter ATP-binding protein [Rhodobacter sp. Har01]MCB6178563.1 ABC transporter ATP-binding protein [Rhodobacter sp. Har01]
MQRTDLVLQDGTMNVLLGPTLAGKTTLMRLIAGLDVPTEGRVIDRGQDVTGVRVQDRKVAMVYQQFINYPSMTVFDNIASPLRILGWDRARIEAAVRKTAGMLRLEPLLDRKPLELSGGQQQRCALARALVKEARIVLLDEPLANLDYKLREELRIEIPRIFQESGAIFVYATTEPEEALLLGGNTATLWEGRITQFGPAPQVYRQPVDATTARVYSDPPMNFAAVRKQGSRLVFARGVQAMAGETHERLADGDYLAGFRANHLRMNAHSGVAVRLDCTIGISEITGSETFLHLDHAGDRWVALVHGVHHPAPGSAVPMWLDPAHVYLFEPGGRLAAPAPYAGMA